MKRLFPAPFLFAVLAIAIGGCSSQSSRVEFQVSYDAETHPGTLDGRVILLISTDDGREPRFQVSAGTDAIAVYGVDVEGLAPGEAARFDASVFGYPVDSIEDAIEAVRGAVPGMERR